MRHKCHHLTLSLECLAEGEGNIACIDPKFHNDCPFKQAHAQKEAERRGKELSSALKMD